MGFWNQDHPLSKEFSRLWDEYVPASGPTEYVETELLRAANRIIYDWYNNGWGGNNKTAELEFLQESGLFEKISNNDIAGANGDQYEKYMDDELASIVELILETEDSLTPLEGNPLEEMGMSSREWDQLLGNYEDDEDEEDDWYDDEEDEDEEEYEEKSSISANRIKEGLFGGAGKLIQYKRHLTKMGIDMSDEGAIAGALKDMNPSMGFRELAEIARALKTSKKESRQVRPSIRESEVDRGSIKHKLNAYAKAAKHQLAGKVTDADVDEVAASVSNGKDIDAAVKSYLDLEDFEESKRIKEGGYYGKNYFSSVQDVKNDMKKGWFGKGTAKEICRKFGWSTAWLDDDDDDDDYEDYDESRSKLKESHYNDYVESVRSALKYKRIEEEDAVYQLMNPPKGYKAFSEEEAWDQVDEWISSSFKVIWRSPDDF